jgi:deoxyribonuclease-4
MSNSDIRFGTGGVPLTASSRDTLAGIDRINQLGLNHLELEFVYSVYLKEKDAEPTKNAAEENYVSLTVHGSYYTNLASPEKQKWHASISRLVKAAKVGETVGAKSITFHPAFYTGQKGEKVMEKVGEALQKAISELEEKQVANIKIAPELTGKKTQFGSIEELVELVKMMKAEGHGERVRFCIDFAHKHARNQGEFKTKSDYRQMFDYIIAELGEEYLQDLHMHMSAIKYGEKGERNHLTFLNSYEEYADFGIEIPEMEEHYQELKKKNRLGGGEQDWKGLLSVLKEYKVSGYLVCESPNLEHDALLMQKVYNEL